MVIPRLIGMVHLAALPDSPGYGGNLAHVIEHARADATTLAEAGFDAVMVENFGDAPFHAVDVPDVTVAAMAVAVQAVRDASGLPVGVNVLRNDAIAALAVAAATGAELIRVNVLSGTMFTDQGTIEGKAADVARTRAAWCPDVAVLADVMVKHATPPPGLTLEAAAADLAERSGADGIVVSGRATGSPAATSDLETVRRVVGELPLVVGSGVTTDTVSDLLQVADAVICGTSIKLGGVTTNPIDPVRAQALVAAAG